eukprot:COSAG01_NODE_6312_length_3742_cov_16.851771_1_plen_80_part_10
MFPNVYAIANGAGSVVICANLNVDCERSRRAQRLTCTRAPGQHFARTTTITSHRIVEHRTHPEAEECSNDDADQEAVQPL